MVGEDGSFKCEARMPTTTHLRELGTRVLPGGAPLLRTPVQAVIASVFGRPPFDPTRAPGDPGLHGPDSATWQVIGEPAAIVGGVRGLMVQLLHPLAMAGVADHSAFEADPLGRLQRTSAYVVTSSFGCLDEALEVAGVVRARHGPVRGRAPDGRPYHADDPDLLAWVSMALTESFLAADATYAPVPVAGRRADAFVREQSRIAALLDPRVDLDALGRDPASRQALREGTMPLPMIEEGRLPGSVTELRAGMAAHEAQLEINEQGRMAIAFLERPPLDRATAAAYRPILEGARATIPADRRRRCGWPTDPRRDRVARAAAFALVGALRLGGGPLESRRRAQARAAMVPRDAAAA